MKTCIQLSSILSVIYLGFVCCSWINDFVENDIVPNFEFESRSKNVNSYLIYIYFGSREGCAEFLQTIRRVDVLNKGKNMLIWDMAGNQTFDMKSLGPREKVGKKMLFLDNVSYLNGDDVSRLNILHYLTNPGDFVIDIFALLMWDISHKPIPNLSSETWKKELPKLWTHADISTDALIGRISGVIIEPVNYKTKNNNITIEQIYLESQQDSNIYNDSFYYFSLSDFMAFILFIIIISGLSVIRKSIFTYDYIRYVTYHNIAVDPPYENNLSIDNNNNNNNINNNNNLLSSDQNEKNIPYVLETNSYSSNNDNKNYYPTEQTQNIVSYSATPTPKKENFLNNDNISNDSHSNKNTPNTSVSYTINSVRDSMTKPTVAMSSNSKEIFDGEEDGDNKSVNSSTR